jgi:hypothetical protein
VNKDKIRETFAYLRAEGADGFTLTLDGDVHRPATGYAVANGTYANLEEAMNAAQPHEFIGYWFDPETGREYVEVVDIFENLLFARIAGKQRDQKAIYDFSTDLCIYLTIEAQRHAARNPGDGDSHGHREGAGVALG